MIVGCLLVPSVEAALIDFEGLADSDPVTTQFPGLTFTNATVLTAGISLNEFELPPHSGANVIYDDGGPIVIDFSAPVAGVSGFFNYRLPLTLMAFDATFNPVATDTSDFFTNLALSGDPGSAPNELFNVVFAGGISRVTIVGDPSGSSFSLDDLARTTMVPEPSTLFLLITGLTGFLVYYSPKTAQRNLVVNKMAC